MHYVFAIRGDLYDVQRIITALEGKEFNLPITLADGTKVNAVVAGRVEPIQLFSYVFPEQYSDVVLNSLGGTKENMERWYHKNTFQNLLFGGMRKALHCEPIPTPKTQDRFLLPVPSIQNVSIMPIGIKKDILDWKDPNGSTHEAL